MTPKETAKQLYKEYLFIMPKPCNDTYTNAVDVSFRKAKVCALFCVNKLINSHIQDKTDNQYYFWCDVKNELEQL